jgi:hypothetical protein
MFVQVDMEEFGKEPVVNMSWMAGSYCIAAKSWRAALSWMAGLIWLAAAMSWMAALSWVGMAALSWVAALSSTNDSIELM